MVEPSQDIKKSESQDEGGRQEGVDYKATKGNKLEREEIEKLKGEYDENNFYVLEEGDFYDPSGYYFDKEGYDQYGGYYEEGQYVPGPEQEEEYYRRYQEVYGEEEYQYEDEYDIEDYFSEEDDESIQDLQKDISEFNLGHQEERKKQVLEVEGLKEEEEKELEAEANRLAIYADHILPAIEWLKQQPKEKKFVVKIKNIPLQAKVEHIQKYVLKRLEDAKEPLEAGKKISEIAKIVIDKDKQGHSMGEAWFSSSFRPAIIQLVKSHNKFWIKNKLKTFLMEVVYNEDADSEGEEEEDYHTNISYEKMLYRKKLRQQGYRDPATKSSQQTIKPIVATPAEVSVAEKPVASKSKFMDDDDYGTEVIQKNKK